MTRSGPPYDAFIWFVVVSGSIAVIAHIILYNLKS